VGPGLGMCVIVLVIVILVGFFALIFGILWFPIKRFLNKKKRKKAD